MKTFRIPERQIKVFKEVDVVVAGGGPAGFSAAVSAARNGLKTLLIERFGTLGGMWTSALVNPYFDVEDKGGLNEELRNRLIKSDAWGGLWNISYDPADMIMQLDQITEESGVDILFYSLATEPVMDGNKVKGVIVEGKSGSMAVLAKQVIDCTGDADIAARAGCGFQTGRPSDGLMQPMTMMFRIGGLSEDYPDNNIIKWYEKLKEIVGEDELLKNVPFNNPALVALPRAGEAVIQWTHMVNFSGIDAEDLSKATLEGRRQVRNALNLMKKLGPEFGDIYLQELPIAIGVRETRRIEGEYTITLDDLKEGRRFDDGICLARFPVDIHEPDNKKQTVAHVKPYHIPYRSLVPRGVENLLVAGRPISGTYEAHASYRVTGNCVSMGEAAGLGASIAVKNNVSPRDVSGKEIADRLRDNGVKLD
jgi:hypothetical protein